MVYCLSNLEIQNMKAELIQFKTPDNLFLPGLLFRSSTFSTKVAIYLHGNGTSSILNAVDKINDIAKSLSKKNISFLVFNNRGAQLIHKAYREIDGKKEKVKTGTAYEIIRDCIYDINGALDYLKTKGFETFYLIGNSTGANKICVYNFYKPKNPFSKFILISGGDDTGFNYHLSIRTKSKLYKYLKISEDMINRGKGEIFIPKYFLGGYLLTYQSFKDQCDPNGNYNVFPYYEILFKDRLGKKPFFKEYKSIKKPTLVIYGENDEYCYGKVPQIIELLRKNCTNPKQFKFAVIKNTDHSLEGKEKELAKLITEFLAK